MKHLPIICNIAGLVTILIMLAFLVHWTYQPQCPDYKLPDYLESRTDRECLAIGILLKKATNNGQRCVTVTNEWFDGMITAEQAKDLANGY